MWVLTVSVLWCNHTTDRQCGCYIYVVGGCPVLESKESKAMAAASEGSPGQEGSGTGSLWKRQQEVILESMVQERNQVSLIT